MELEYRVPMELIEFTELVRDRLAWYSQSSMFCPRHASLLEEFVEYTTHSFAAETGLFEGSDPPYLKDWVDNWIAKAEFRWRDEVAKSVGFDEEDDQAWKEWAEANMTRYNRECAFKY